jgi:DNA (cytosine-5)-methyltransferase 1
VTLTVGSLFSGIGGIDLGLERAGMTVKWHSEIDPYACRVLKKHWPDVPNLGNIKEIDWATVELVDVIAGGYPCQPFSTAGKRQGDKDERHLWPYFLRAISELRPRFALLENVRGHLSMGFDRVLGDLAEIGYDAEWQIVSAASVGAPHRRDRIICVAYPSEQYSNGKSHYARNSVGSETLPQSGNSGWAANVANPNDTGSRTPERDMGKRGAKITQDWQGHSGTQHGISGCSTDLADTTSKGLQRSVGKVFKGDRVRSAYGGWQWWETEPDVGRVAHGIPSRVDRLRGLGNAVVPQVAEYVGRMIMASL